MGRRTPVEGRAVIREIEARTILGYVKHPNAWFGVRYNVNLYRGCEHQSIYCDSRSACYGIEDFSDVLVKANAVTPLEAEIRRKRQKGTIGTGSMSDPYTWAKRRYNLTGRALEVIARHGYPAHLTTKSDLVLRDLETLREINRTWASVSFTVTTADDDLALLLDNLGQVGTDAPLGHAGDLPMR
jgi:DNA repair photolyase